MEGGDKISIFLKIKRFLSWLFGGNERNQKLAAWAKTIEISPFQQDAIWELWISARAKRVPENDPLERLSEKDLDYLKKICSADFRPTDFGDASVLRLSSFRYYVKIGFSPLQSAIIVGMMFNMIGRKDL